MGNTLQDKLCYVQDSKALHPRRPGSLMTHIKDSARGCQSFLPHRHSHQFSFLWEFTLILLGNKHLKVMGREKGKRTDHETK